MAKVTSPLFSFKATGQLAKTLVYSSWKAIKDVRSWAKPSNPNTAAQQQQRGFFSQAVTFWHTYGFSPADLTAWNLSASVSSKIQSGFNNFVQLVVNALRLGSTFENISNITSVPAGANQTATAASGNPAAGFCNYGTNKTALNQTVGIVGASATMKGLVSGANYYYRFVFSDVGDAA